MKTAISLPDETFDRASRRAKELGLSRSEFFARAADSYLEKLDRRSTVEQIDAAVERIGAADESVVDAVRVGHLHLAGIDDEW